ncbi:MAG: sensor histidine kinase [Phototrophicaceae bacterium]
MTIRTKLILWYSGLLAFIIVVFGGTVFGLLRWTLVSTIDQSLSDAAAQVVENSRAVPIGEFGSPNSVRVDLPPLTVFGLLGVYVQVWDIAGEQPRLAAASGDEDYLLTALDGEHLTHPTLSRADVIWNEQEMRVLTYPVNLADGSILAVVQTGSALETVNQAIDRLLTVLMLAMSVAIIGSVVVGLLLADRALQPVDDIIHAAAKITETDDLGTRLPWNGPMDELGRLTAVFNRMMTRLEHLFGVQQRFVADVSHELRTPLTAIRGNLDLIQRYGVDDESIEAISSEVGRMTRMVDDLLMLARAEYGGIHLELDPLDLDVVVASVYREAKAIVHARGGKLTVVMGRFEPVRINGNADRIKQLILNLVGNAIKFTPEGGEIKLSLSEEGAFAVMRVSDSGIGIRAEDIPHIFERFFQAEGSRARTESDTGTGLGLAICRWITEAHRGTIKVDSIVGKGTTFTIVIPKMEHTASTKANIRLPVTSTHDGVPSTGGA